MITGRLTALGVLTFALSFSAILLFRGKVVPAAPHAPARAPTATRDCDPPPEVGIRRAIDQVPPEVLTRMPMPTREALTRFASENMPALVRGYWALVGALKPHYADAKRCFRASAAPAPVDLIIEWQAKVTPSSIRLTNPKLVRPEGLTSTPAGLAASRCIASLMSRTIVSEPIASGSTPDFVAYEGPLPLPLGLRPRLDGKTSPGQ